MSRALRLEDREEPAVTRRSWLWLLAPFPFAVWRIFYLYSINVDQMDLSALTVPLLGALGIAALVTLFCLLLVRLRPDHAAVLSSAVLLLFFSFGQIRDSFGDTALSEWLERTASIGADVAVGAAATIVIGLLALSLRKRQLPASGLVRYAAVFGVALFVSSLSMAGFALVRQNGLSDGPNRADALDMAYRTPEEIPEMLPDIYFIVLDRYMGGPELAEVCGDDNSEFLDHLRSLGFYVADVSRSNYSLTHISLAATLDMRYMHDLTDIPGLTGTLDPAVRADFEPFYDAIDDNAVARILDGFGYRYVHVSSGWGATNDNPMADLVLKTGFDDELVELLLESTMLGEAWVLSVEEAKRYRVIKTFDQLANVPESEGPSFVFAHIMMPHPPYVFRSDGTPQATDLEDIIEENSDGHTALYHEQLLYVNTLVKDLVETLLSREGRPVIIVIQGDHGGTYNTASDENTEEDRIRRKHSILNAIYLPHGIPDSIYPSISSVNTFRLILTEYGMADLELLEDRSYFSYTGLWPYWPPDVTDVVAATRD